VRANGFVAGTLVHTKAGLLPIEKIEIGDWVLSKPQRDVAKAEYKRVTNIFEFDDNPIWLIQAYVYKVDEKSVPYDADYQLIGCTSNHSFRVENKGWTQAAEVRMSSVLQLANGKIAYVLCSLGLHKAEDGKHIAWGERVHGGAAGDGSGYNVTFDDKNISVGELGPLRTCAFDLENAPSWENWERGYGFTRKVYNFEVEDFHTYFIGEMGVWVGNTNYMSPSR
jgi:hypothetical protein